jgi:hypothetical protein
LINQLKTGFPNAKIHSEYGMTELMSQAYADDALHYIAGATMKFFIGDPTDPFQFFPLGRRGIINIIDLANLHTCSFIQTGDLGLLNEAGGLQVLGRFKMEDVRGCVQMYD